MWTDGTSVDYENWSRREPNDEAPGYKSGCDHMVWARGQWKDRKNLEKNNYICQYEEEFKRRKRSTPATDRTKIEQVLLGGCAKQRKKRESNILLNFFCEFKSLMF